MTRVIRGAPSWLGSDARKHCWGTHIVTSLKTVTAQNAIYIYIYIRARGVRNRLRPQNDKRLPLLQLDVLFDLRKRQPYQGRASPSMVLGPLKILKATTVTQIRPIFAALKNHHFCIEVRKRQPYQGGAP